MKVRISVFVKKCLVLLCSPSFFTIYVLLSSYFEISGVVLQYRAHLCIIFYFNLKSVKNITVHTK